MIDVALTLDYRLAQGWRAPFLDGLAEGRAVARRCTCGRVSFPPLRRCDCGAAEGAWIDLPGAAAIRHRTEGSDGAFALVRFEGADTDTVVRLEGVQGNTGRLLPQRDGVPRLVLGDADR